MKHVFIRTAVAAAALAITSVGPAAQAGGPHTPLPVRGALAIHGGAAQRSNVRAVCPPAPGQARCFAQVRTDVHGGFGRRGPAAGPTGSALPPGYGPADLRSAYQLPAVGGQGQTVAVVDAGDDPAAEADLAVYRSTYGLPPCTTANGCFSKVNQAGSAAPLPSDQGWGMEISLDLDMVSGICPSCRIVLAEADSAYFGDLAAAEDTAVRLGATEVSNSYGATEQNGMQTYEAAYAHPGTAIVASSGDFGYGIPSFPAVFSTVLAVGGTTLTRASTSRGWAEAAWWGSGSGCSGWITKPAWQHDPNCPGRMTADVAADADPQTGPAVYDAYDGYGWAIVGGTSAAAPLIAGVIALAGNPASFPDPSYLYFHGGALNDITTGTNNTGIDCGGDYQCNAVPGYDGPTGNGTPNGLGAF